MQTRAFDQHLHLREPRTPGSGLVETTAGNGWGDADGDGGEHQRIEQGLLQEHVDREDRDGERSTHVDPGNIENVRSPAGTRSRPRASLARGDGPELGVHAGRHRDADARPARHDRAARAQQARSASAAPSSTGVVDFSTGAPSPVSTDSSHSGWWR